ncbi:hypothetical protein GCM10028789_14400 [Sinomonas halotolerans]
MPEDLSSETRAQGLGRSQARLTGFGYEPLEGLVPEMPIRPSYVYPERSWVDLCVPETLLGGFMRTRNTLGWNYVYPEREGATRR